MKVVTTCPSIISPSVCLCTWFYPRHLCFRDCFNLLRGFYYLLVAGRSRDQARFSHPSEQLQLLVKFPITALRVESWLSRAPDMSLRNRFVSYCIFGHGFNKLRVASTKWALRGQTASRQKDAPTHLPLALSFAWGKG